MRKEGEMSDVEPGQEGEPGVEEPTTEEETTEESTDEDAGEESTTT